MIERVQPSAALLRLADLQERMVTIDQLRGHDLGRRPTERMIAEGRWQRVGGGVIYLGETEPPWPALAWAGVLIGGDSARLGGFAALFAAGAAKEEPEPITVLIPHDKRLSDRGPWHFVRERCGVRDARTFGSPPRIGVEDAVLDAAAEFPAAEVVTLVSDAIQSQRTKTARLLAAIGRRAHLSHRELLLGMLRDAEVDADSELERRFLHDVERAHGLPTGRRQVRVGYARHRRDVWYELYRLVVELDGHLGHEGSGRFRDMARDNLALLVGDATLRYGWLDVTARPCVVAWQIAVVLGRLGWSGVASRCSKCASVPESKFWGS